jgi:hypothetical protein
MQLSRLAAAALCAAIATAATADPVTMVVDVPVPDGTQRFLYTRPDAPVANIIAIPGGDGLLAIQPDGTIASNTGRCSPVVRNHDAFAARGFAVALVDQASNGMTYNYDDVIEVVRYLLVRDNVPVWFIGGSASTNSVADFANRYPADKPGGLVMFSTDKPDVPVISAVTRPTLVVFNPADTGQSSQALFAALTSATIKQLTKVSGGSNSNCGYHLFQGMDAAFVDAVGSFIDQHNYEIPPRSAVNYGGLWWNAPAGSEPGWGINFAHQGDTIFATWFTFGLDGNPLWLVTAASKSAPNVYSGKLYTGTGPPLGAVQFDSSKVSSVEAGTATFTFGDDGNATFAYTVDGVAQTKTITRQQFGTAMPACTWNAGTSLASATNFQDIWWAAPSGSESGWGINLNHQGDTIFGAWFTFGTDGKPLWLVVAANRTAPNVYSGDLYTGTGPAYNAVPFDPATVAPQKVGSATFTFVDGNTASFAYSVALGGDVIARTKSLTRQVFAAPGTVCR